MDPITMKCCRSTSAVPLIVGDFVAGGAVTDVAADCVDTNLLTLVTQPIRRKAFVNVWNTTEVNVNGELPFTVILWASTLGAMKQYNFYDNNDDVFFYWTVLIFYMDMTMSEIKVYFIIITILLLLLLLILDQGRFVPFIISSTLLFNCRSNVPWMSHECLTKPRECLTKSCECLMDTLWMPH